MPVLGHATWHLYRKAVEPDASPRPEFHPRPRDPRYAADFPTALFLPLSRDKTKDSPPGAGAPAIKAGTRPI